MSYNITMKIIKKSITECDECGNFRGEVKEKYNGDVPVYCKCDLDRLVVEKKNWESPCMVSPDGEKLWWAPITNHKVENGDLIHTPHFFGPALKRKKE